jgi:hypothetical protein
MALITGPNDLPELAGLRRGALMAGGIGLLATLVGALLDPTQFFRSYLVAFLLWLGIGLGSLALLMIYHLTGGGWGVAVRRIFEASAGTLPLMALLFLPLVLGLHDIYEWTHTEVMKADPILRQKMPYLNVPFFLVRAAIYFAAWLALAYFLRRWSAEQEETGSPSAAVRMRKLSGGGILLWGVMVTFAAFDWVMSLEPHWFSTIFGMIIMAGMGLSALAFTLVTAYLLSARGAYARVLAPTIKNDLGNLLLAFVMLWAYLSFSQLLIIWAGNLPEEIPWYLHRIGGGWNAIAVALAVFHFALPFLILLGRRNKRQLGRLAIIAAGVLVMRVVDLFYLVAPEFHEHGFGMHWLDIATVLGVGGLWVIAFLWRLGGMPLLAVNDPELSPALSRQH